MKKLHVLTLSLFFGSLFTAKSQCNEVVFTNDFSSTTGWTNVGNGESNISGGTFNLVNAYGSAYNKDYHGIGKNLSDTYFKAECKFTINSSNPSGYGVGSLIMGLTAGTLDFFSYDASGSFGATSQDAIGVDINSPSAADNNINDWDIFIATKKGSTYAPSSPILAISSIGTYYVRLERTSKGMTKLSVFSDSTFTTNITGSPVTFAIDSTITGLNTVQHGTNTWGTSTRLANISIDNDNICDDGKEAPSFCNEVIFTNDFSSTTGWTNVGNGESNISGGTFNLVNAYGSAYNKDYHGIGKNISDTYFKAECQFTINSSNPSGYGVGSLIMGLTAGTLDFFSYDASGSFGATSQDAIGVDINSPSAADNNINDWDIFIATKKGSTYAPSTPILAISSIGTYYVRLERTSRGMTKLSVFSDSTFTTNITGSPVTFAIDSTITGLNTVQHGTNTWGTSTRLANISIDNDNICDNGSAEGIENLSQTESWNVYPNPNNGNFSIDFKSPLNEDIMLNLYNMMGQLVMSQKVTRGSSLITLNNSLSAGIYNLVLQGNSEVVTKKMVIAK